MIPFTTGMSSIFFRFSGSDQVFQIRFQVTPKGEREGVTGDAEWVVLIFVLMIVCLLTACDSCSNFFHCQGWLAATAAVADMLQSPFPPSLSG